MNFEELEKLWGNQQAPDPCHRNLAELKQRLRPELRRRSRFFAYEIFCLGFGLVVTPLLAIVNFRHTPPDNVAVYWLHVVLVVTVLLGFLAAAIRRLQRHRALAQADTDTLAAFATQSLANVEAEMKDYRAGRWALALWTGLALLSAWLNQPIAKVGWGPFAGRAGPVLLFGLLLSWLFTRHYRTNLAPERARRKKVHEQLS